MASSTTTLTFTWKVALKTEDADKVMSMLKDGMEDHITNSWQDLRRKGIAPIDDNLNCVAEEEDDGLLMPF